MDIFDRRDGSFDSDGRKRWFRGQLHSIGLRFHERIHASFHLQQEKVLLPLPDETDRRFPFWHHHNGILLASIP